MAKKDFAAMEARGPSGVSAARAAMRSRIGHPSSIRLEELQLNPSNPRYADDDPAIVELAETLKSVGQLQPALVVSAEQYVRAYPDQRGTLGPQPWVVIVGNRRLIASRLAGRAALDVRVDSELETAEELEDRVLIENIQRKDLPPLLEALHLQRRLSRPGHTVRSVGEAIGKSHMYVQQRIDLLRMIPEFQDLFRQGQINIKTGRQLGTMSEADQRDVLAAGTPYSPAARPKPAEPVNAVSNATAGSGRGDSAASSPTVGAAVAESPQPAAPRPPAASVPSPSDEPGQTTPVPQAPAEHRDAGETAEPMSGPASGFGLLEPTRASVARWLDNAVADLDRVLSDCGDPAAADAFADARRCIRDAHAALNRITRP